MSYFLRYISNDSRSLTLEDLETALQTSDAKYAIKRSLVPQLNSGELRYGRALYAIVEVVGAMDGEVEELSELRTLVEAMSTTKNESVLERLRRCTNLLTVEVKFQGRSTEKTLQKLDPLWDWLILNRRGMIHADGEGFYEGMDLILDMSASPRQEQRTLPCPYCGIPLRTDKAKQCFECGADWHFD